MKLEELIIAKAAKLNGCSDEEDRISTAVLFVAKDLHSALEKINAYRDYTSPEGMTRIASDALAHNVELSGTPGFIGESVSNVGVGGATKCCEHGFIGMDASFIHEAEVGAHPIVTVRFALEDWESRDAFVEHFRCIP